VLNNKYHEFVQKELIKLNKLNDETIEDIVNRIPDEMLTEKHK